MTAFSIATATATSLTRALSAAGAGGGFNPASLFVGGIRGIALDLSDMSLLFQDAARTTPVTATGQPIGSPSDISGNGLHPTQATALNRPTYDGDYATFDGTTDGWASPAINLTGVDVITIIASVRKNSDATLATFLETNTVGSNGTFDVQAPNANGATNFAFRIRGTSLSTASIATPYAAGTNYVLTCQGDIGTSQSVRINGASVVSGASASGTGNFGNWPLYIGNRLGSTNFFSGRLHRLIVIGRVLTAQELAAAEAWCGEPAGIFF